MIWRPRQLIQLVLGLVIAGMLISTVLAFQSPGTDSDDYLAEDDDLIDSILAIPLPEQWVRRYDGPISGADGAVAIGVDGSDRIVVSGDSESEAMGSDYVTIGYTSGGFTRWTSRYNGTGNSTDLAFGLSVAPSGSSAVTGESYAGVGPTTADYATVLYTEDGAVVWARRYDGPAAGRDRGTAVVIDVDGNVVVTGWSDGLAGAGEYFDYATVKYDPAGVQLWAERYNGPDGFNDYATAIAADSDGNIYVTGWSESTIGGEDCLTIKYDSDGALDWFDRYNGSGGSQDRAVALSLDGSENPVITGSAAGDFLTIRYDDIGTRAWVRFYDGAGRDDFAVDLAVGLDNSVYVVGGSNRGLAGYDLTTVKYSSLGAELWHNDYDSIGDYDQATAIVLDAADNLYVTGYSVGPAVNDDYVTVSYDPAGVEQWVVRYNGPGDAGDQSNGVALDDLGNVYVTGVSAGSGTDDDATTIKYCNGCWITGICYTDQSINLFEPCQVCDVTLDRDDWSPNDGASCDDNDFCNGTDTCQGGSCSEHSGTPCPDDGLFCTGVEACNEFFEICTQVNVPDCEDAIYCNGVEFCDEINDRCAPGPPVDCPGDGLFCNGDEICDEDLKDCVSDGNPCEDDTLFCNGVETCNETTDICESIMAPCPDDGFFCNGKETCNEENDVCNTVIKPCPEDSLFCNGEEYCNEQQDRCEQVFVPECDDGLYCNGVEICNETARSCQPGANPCPNDNLFCNGLEGCDERLNRCTHYNPPCPDDGQFCNGAESCDENQDICESSGDPCVDDLIYCNGYEGCNEALNQCLHSGNPCPDDGLFCNGFETCDEAAEQCRTTGNPCPDDGLWCTGSEYCDETGNTCKHTGSVCIDDGLYCNGIETCDDAKDQCMTSGNPCSDDGVWCNGTEFCDENKDACDTTGDVCPDDGLFCNGVTGCDEAGQTCIPPVLVVCPDDAIYCNGDEFCSEEERSCSHSGDPCEADALFCNGEEVCDFELEECVSEGNPCSDDETCDEEDDECLEIPLDSKAENLSGRGCGCD